MLESIGLALAGRAGSRLAARLGLPAARHSLLRLVRGLADPEIGAVPPATVIAERIGWSRSIRVLSARVAELRPAYLPPDPASRAGYVAGDIAQCDFWFPPIKVPVGFGQIRGPKQLPVLTMVCGYSRTLAGLLIPSRTAEDLFAGWWQLLQALGAVPRTLVWDGEGAIGRWRGGQVELTKECQAFRGTLGTKVIVCRPADPEAKGIIERAHQYLETSFLPGRQFTSPADFNTQLRDWLAVANTRTRRALGCAPSDRIAADKAAMLSLPPVPPATGWRSSLRLPRDYYIRLDSNDYSVSPVVIGRRIEVVADLERVRVFYDGKLAADHERIWACHQTLSDPNHVTAANMLRQARTARTRRLRAVNEPEVEVRCLADYDTALGVESDHNSGHNSGHNRTTDGAIGGANGGVA
nr:DDE-type integrase/transposase/recombinase [Fodinicola acaciae]